MKKLIFIIGLAGVFAHDSAAQSADLIRQRTTDAYAKIANRDLDGFAGYLADNCFDYQGSLSIKGKKAVLDHIQTFLMAFPGYTFDVLDIAVSGNKASVYTTFRGTQTKNLMQMPATGRKVEWTDVDILEFDPKGKIRAHWINNKTTLLD